MKKWNIFLIWRYKILLYKISPSLGVNRLLTLPMEIVSY